jgi:hypothetical protein
MNVLAWLRASDATPDRLRLLNRALIILALLTAIPIAVQTYDRIIEVRYHARMQFITLHRLWELHPEYQGTPQTWTRVAARVLTDRQLMYRVVAKYGTLAEQIETDYHRDLAIAAAEVVSFAFAGWAVPLLALYGVGYLACRRRRAPVPAQVAAASALDPRYMPAADAIEKNGGNP